MIWLVVIGGFVLMLSQVSNADKKHAEYKAKHPGATWVKPSGSMWILCLGGSVFLTAFLYIGSTGGLTLVRVGVPCQDGRRVQIHVNDTQAQDAKELKEQGCVQVDGKGNLVKYDRDTGETIFVDPVTGEQVQGQD